MSPSSLFRVLPDRPRKDEAHSEPHLFRSPGKHIVIAAGGKEERPEELLPQLGQVDRVFAADGGWRLVRELGLSCHLLVGDFDTLHPREVLEAEASGSEIERHPRSKAQSDLEIALEHALRQGASEVTLIGALGGEWDHCLANLVAPLSYLNSQGLWARLLSSEAQIYLAEGSVLVRAPEHRVSLQALSARVEGLHLEGFEYCVKDQTLHRHQTLGLANRALSEEARISFLSGELFITVMTPRTGQDSP